MKGREEYEQKTRKADKINEIENRGKSLKNIG